MNKPPIEKGTKVAYQIPIGTWIILVALSVLCPLSLLAGGTLALPALGTVLGIALLSFACVISGKSWILLSSVASMAMVYLLTGDWMMTLAILLFPLSAAVISLTMRRGENKTQTTLWGAFAIGAVIVGILAVYVYVSSGTFSLQPLKDFFNQIFANVKESGLSAMKQMGAEDDTLTKTSQQWDIAIQYVKWMMPGTFGALCLILSYISVTLTGLLTVMLHCPQAIKQRPFCITMSRASAVVYIFAYLIMVFFSGKEGSTTQVVTLNLVVLLAPGLFVVGLGMLFSLFRHPRVARLGWVIGIVLLSFLFFSPISFVGCVVLIAVWRILFQPLHITPKEQ